MTITAIAALFLRQIAIDISHGFPIVILSGVVGGLRGDRAHNISDTRRTVGAISAG